MYIQPNKFLTPTARNIKFCNGSLISTIGPNINGKLDLSDLQINYESQFVSRMILNPQSVNQPILYGFLGNNVTFLALKITYNETDPQCLIEEEQYIEYYYKDDVSKIRYANKLLVLTGNSVKRVPQIFLNNPSTFPVYVDVLVGNLAQADILPTDVTDNSVTIDNLYYNSVISDTFWNMSRNASGSTQFQILNIDDVVELYLDYTEIKTIEKDIDTISLIINTNSETVIHLVFLSIFELNQANSRINWVIKNKSEQYLTKEYPSIDTTSPVITLNNISPISPNTYDYTMPFVTGQTITPANIIDYFIDVIFDNRDGEINKHDSLVKIRKNGHTEQLTGITEIGIYDIIITISDIANNMTLLNILLYVDNQPPVITFKSGIGSNFDINIPADLRIPASGVTVDDVIRKTIDNIYDIVDGVIHNSGVTITVENDTFPILVDGTYNITYNVSDKAGNIVFYDKVMNVITV